MIPKILLHFDVTSPLGLQRHFYKYTESGVAISFRTADGTLIEQEDLADVKHSLVAAIGVSCIIEGTDCEVPTKWLEFKDFDLPAEFCQRLQDLVEEVDSLAFEIYHAD